MGLFATCLIDIMLEPYVCEVERHGGVRLGGLSYATREQDVGDRSLRSHTVLCE